MNKTLQHHFRAERKHQMDIANDGGGSLEVFPNGRTELSFGSAPFGEHALSAFVSAKGQIAFMKRWEKECQT
ncbi:MAG: hypothetical protein GY753_09670 [Gammaproteobacteria bacterium]|nr:hypothetical protein [Gammaproteobacteria bacterium]